MKQPPKKPNGPPKSSQKSLKIALVLVGLIAAGALVIYSMRPASHRSDVDIKTRATESNSLTAETPVAAQARLAVSTPGQGSAVQTNPLPLLSAASLAPANTNATSPPPELPGDPRQLVASLADLDLSTGSITSEQATRWKQTLQVLVRRGRSAVPAIREFLAKNVDVDLDQLAGGNLLGYGTLRLALFDMLRKINGPESIATSLEVLKTSADPKEIATLARNLEQQAPGQHSATAVAAAREALAQANRGQLEGPDLGPVFEVLQHHGGVNAATELEQVASKWNFYSAIALGGLPEGAGIPALKRMAKDNAIPNVAALRVLAQLAGKYPEAKTALLAQIRSNTIPYPAWSGVQSALAGELIDYANPAFGNAGISGNGENVRTYHITYGNQNYRTFSVITDWPQAQLKQQLALIDELIAADASLETLQFLQNARLTLAGRLAK